MGDIKPLEVPLTFAMALAWNVHSIKPDVFRNFFEDMAKRDFGGDTREEVSNVSHEYDKLVYLRRHEHIEPDTFSLLNCSEAEIILSRWKTLLENAEAIQKEVPDEKQASIFELVVHPVKASSIFITIHITLGRNQLYARQHRNSANNLAKRALKLFDDDFTLSEEFNALLNGKWIGIMQQPHYGFGGTWHAPSRDMISGLCFVQKRQNSNAVVGQMGGCG